MFAHTNLSSTINHFGDQWFEHVQRRDIGNVGRRMLGLELAGRRPRRRTKMRFVMWLKKKKKSWCWCSEDSAENRARWRLLIACCHH